MATIIVSLLAAVLIAVGAWAVLSKFREPAAVAFRPQPCDSECRPPEGNSQPQCVVGVEP